MTIPVFPVLAGQGFSVHKKPTMSTLVAPHVSGREVRAQLYQNPIWQFEMPFNGLDGTATGQYGALGAQSMQSLMGLFLQCGGQFGVFVYYDPTDYAVSAQGFGTGNGTATAFALTRALGGFVEDVVAPFTATAPTLFSLPGSTFYAPNNLLANANVGSGSELILRYVTITGAQPDPFGGSLGVLLAETTATNIHLSYDTATVPPGVPMTFSVYLIAGGASKVQLFIQRGGSPYETIYANFDLTAGTVTYQNYRTATGPLVASIANAGGGWYRCSISGMPAATLTSVATGIAGINNTPLATLEPSYAGSTSNTFGIAFPQLEVTASAGPPSPYWPTLSTPYYGSPSISVAGTYVDPSTYTIANGIVTFGSAPANTAALQWSGYFGFLCRFDDDSVDFDQFMSNLWQVESLKFRSVRGQ